MRHRRSPLTGVADASEPRDEHSVELVASGRFATTSILDAVMRWWLDFASISPWKLTSAASR